MPFFGKRPGKGGIHARRKAFELSERGLSRQEVPGERKRSGACAEHLRKLVNRLRRQGVPIASDRQGYFYAATAGEVYTTIRQLQQMVNGLQKAIAGLEGSLEKFGEADGAGGDLT